MVAIPQNQIFPFFSALGGCSIEIKEPFSILTKIKPVSTLGMDGDILVYGNRATYNFVRGLHMKYKKNDNTIFDSLKPGWQWTFDIGVMILTVKDDTGSVKAIRDIQYWSDLQVSYEVLTSAQFIYFKNAKAISDRYYQVSRIKSDRVNTSYSYSYGSIENYLSDIVDSIMPLMYVQPLLLDASATYDIPPIITKEITCIYEELRPVIKNIAIDLIPFIDEATNMFLYSNNKSAQRTGKSRNSSIENISKFIFIQMLTLSILQDEDKPFIDEAIKIFLHSNNKPAKRISRLRNSLIENIGKFVFIQMLTLSILQGGDKPCFEPWMIWEMWKYIPRNNSGEIDNKIFDLSPWWG